MRILGAEVWPPDVISDVHSVYVQFELNNQKEQEELKEILFLMGTGLFETAHIRYMAIKQLLLTEARLSTFSDILAAQFALERVIDG